VLNFAKLEGGHVKFDVTSVPLFELVAGLEVLVAPQLQAKNQSLDCPSVDKSLVARADPEKARQVLLNLLSNAIKFTGRNGRITMEAVAAPEGLEVRVKDTGIGIPADKLRDIFEPFVQVDGGLARVHEGTGLGLAISRDLARGMGGELVAESSEGEGSTFTLRLQPAGASPAKASTPSGQ
jgi:signal transduction histidine kinase